MLSSILSILGFLPKVLSSVDNITNAIANERLALINAKTAKEKQESLERLGQLEAQRSVLESDNTATNKTNQYVRFLLFGLPSGLAIWKLVVWDKIIGSFTGCAGPASAAVSACRTFRTDSFDVNMWWVVLAAAGFYLLTTRK